MRVFKYTGFSRFAKKEGITDAELIDIISQLEDDQADANLGGDVYKVRLARAGKGKSGGHRVIVYLKMNFVHFLFMVFQNLIKIT